MPSIVITDQGNSIKIGVDSNQPFYIDKPYTIIATDSCITLRNSNFGMFSFEFSDVTIPSVVDINTLEQTLAGYLNTISGGGENGSGGSISIGSITINDGSDITQGSTTDNAVTTDSNGTVSSKLRGLVKIFSSVWDSVNGRLKVDGSSVTQPISVGSLPLPTGASTATNQATEINILSNILTNTSNEYIATTSGNSYLNLIESNTSNIPSKGQSTMSNSMPVTIASDQTLPLPTGAASSSNQLTEISNLSSIVTNTANISNSSSSGNISLSTIASNTSNIPSKGSAISSNSMPVTIASDQTVPISVITLPLPTGAASSSNQLTEISTLTNIEINTANISNSSSSGNISLSNIVTNTTVTRGLGLADAGTVRVATSNNLPFGADYLIQSNPDVNGNYQTIQYKQGGSSGTVMRTITLVFDAKNNVVSYTES